MIPEFEKTAKKGVKVLLKTPDVDAAQEILDYVNFVLGHSNHLLTDPDEFTFTLEQQAERIRAFRQHPDKLMICPTVNGRIVGLIDFSCGARRKIAHQGFFGMTVHPSFQNQGIGRMMLDALLGWARGNPRLETVRLQVHSKNHPAIRLYESLGFVGEGAELRGVRYGNGEYDDVLLMRNEVK